LIGKEYEYPELVERASNAMERLGKLQEWIQEEFSKRENQERLGDLVQP
jgi:hypothetical protein